MVDLFPPDQKVGITHHCYGNVSLERDGRRVFNCFELSESGLLVLEDEAAHDSIKISFCPFCGREGRLHAAQNQQGN